MDKEFLTREAFSIRGDTMHVDLFYPGASDNPTAIQVGLDHVRAADDLRITYDMQRDGWIIMQASTFRWESSDTECDPDWQEVAFVKAWARAKPGTFDDEDGR